MNFMTFSFLLANFITGVIFLALAIGIPYFYKRGKINRMMHIKAGRIYYGFFRMIALWLLATWSSITLVYGVVLWYMLSSTAPDIDISQRVVNGTVVSIATFVISIPFIFLYLNIYKQAFRKAINEYKQSQEKTIENDKGE